MNIIKIILLSLLTLVVPISCSNEDINNDPPINDIQKEDNHPFLIVKKEQFQSFRDKASQEPWKSMKEDAMQRAASGSKTDAYALQYYVGAAALAYILDESNSELHANRVRDAILNQYAQIEVKDGSAWSGVVPPMSTFFISILALDIVYDALSIEDIVACEKVIEDQIFKISRTGNWVDARYGTHGTWDIYKGDRTTPDNAYYNGIMLQITEDGVSPVTNHYAWERVGGGNSRLSKSGYMDVLEFTGIDERYYENEKLKKFQRWLFGSSVNCAKEMAIFGDMLPSQGIANDMLHRRVVNFDEEASGYAAWFHEDRPAIGSILTYLIPKKELPQPTTPSSRFYEDGGAFFRENTDDPRGLHAVLYNIKNQDEWHTHNEVNGLALSGLGNRLLVNGGRLGAPTRAAYLNNTLTINGTNHAARVGGGMVEGFTADGLDYGSGFSGRALSNADHYRNLVLVHGTDETASYFIIYDEFEGNNGDVVKNYFHPSNQSGMTTVTEGILYDASIDHEQTISGTQLSFFYATPPSSINIEKVEGAVPDRYPGYPLHSRIESTYLTDDNGKINSITALFPFDSKISKPSALRITGEGISGGIVNHGNNIKDVILESIGDQKYSAEGVDFIAKAVLVRLSGETTQYYFVRHGTDFSIGSIGFESDSPISIYVKGQKGVIVSEGTKIKLKGNGIQSVQFEPAVNILNSGTDFIEIQLPAGEVKFQ
ncbi:MAG: hypothetical protein ACI9FN_003370 [Saprospiraceae bacterium]|jgi:hypothetical protein